MRDDGRMSGNETTVHPEKCQGEADNGFLIENFIFGQLIKKRITRRAGTNLKSNFL